jgi:hypothetical protein
VPILSIARVIVSASRAAQRRRKETAARKEVAEVLAALKASTVTPPDVSVQKR